MPSKMVWLANVVRLAIVPVFLGALFLLMEPQRSVRDLAAAAGLVLLGAIHVLYWWRPWPARPHRSVAAAAGLVLTNFVLLHLLGLTQPLLWLYPALIVGSGLRASAAAVGVGLMVLAAIVPLDLLEGSHTPEGSQWVGRFNTTRPHTDIGDVPPAEHEMIYHAQHQPHKTAGANN